ncbi:MAG: class I SAM-dependent methyltransferase [Promethearchaeota archaeon]
MSFWENAYHATPPWDVSHPQKAFMELFRNNEIKTGRILDVGCGTGDNAIFLASKGFTVIGIDIAPSAIRIAKSKAIEHNVKVDFQVLNSLELDLHFNKNEFDDIIDSGLFHTLTNKERPVFAKKIHYVLRNGGNYFMLCFSDKELDRIGPRRISKNEIIQIFSPLFRINYIHETIFESRIHTNGAKAYITSVTKVI